MVLKLVAYTVGMVLNNRCFWYSTGVGDIVVTLTSLRDVDGKVRSWDGEKEEAEVIGSSNTKIRRSYTPNMETTDTGHS